MIVATSIVRGKIFSVESGPSILKSCIPPTFNKGRIVIAITTIPIPPNHCIIALHNKILFGLLSKSEITVAPVVVIPDILSKNASLKLKFSVESRNGKLPKTATINHAREENKNNPIYYIQYAHARITKILKDLDSESVSKEEILAWFDGKVAKWWIPDDVVFVDSLPHTATGKIQKFELRQEFKDYKLPNTED